MGKVKTLKDDILERELELYRKYYEVTKKIESFILFYTTKRQMNF